MRILGIDPGSRVTGYAVVEEEGNPRVLSWGTLSLKRQDPLPERLRTLYQELLHLWEEFRPGVLVLEEVIPERFPRAALALGQAQGVVLLLAAQKGLSWYLYHPSTVKQTLTGNGRASKEQVAYMVKNMLNLEEDPPLDATDALALALTHLLRIRSCFPR